MRKANTLLDDVNGKVATIDPLFTAVADLSESVSDINASSRKLVTRLNRGSTKRKTTSASAVVLAKTAKKFFVKKDKTEAGVKVN